MEKWMEWVIGIAATVVIGLGVYNALPTPVQNAVSNTVNAQLAKLP